MRLALKLHSDSQCDAIKLIEVEAARSKSGTLHLRYIVNGIISDLRRPPAMPPARADELWRHTCFEAFVQPPLEPAYYEFNFAPSMQWAAYRFGAYRTGMAVATEMSAPRLAAQSDGEAFELQALLELGELHDLPKAAPWRLGLSAVIEETSGRKSYWALAHPRGEPDFHRSDGFAVELSPANSK